MIRRKGFHSKIATERYCCAYGYLTECQDIPVESIAEEIGMSKAIVWYHYRQLRKGRIKCLKLSDCIFPQE